MMEQTSQEVELAELPLSFEAAGMTVQGTISKPAGEGPFPAVVVAAGSGPTDRDWRSPMLPGDNGSAKLLADALAERGVVLLRYDKRGIGATGMPAEPIAWNDYATELAAAAAALAEQPFVDATKVYVAGHSEGGVHALLVAEAPPVPIAGLLLLSAAGRTLRDVVIGQIAAQLDGSGLNDAAVEAEITALTNALDTIAHGEAVDPTTVGQLPGIQQFIVALQDPMSVQFARGLLLYDPTTALSKVNVPVLVLSGDRDFQIDPLLDAKVLAEASDAAGNPTTFVIVDDADHVLKSEATPKEQVTGQLALSYNADGRVISPGVVDAIVKFVTGP